MRRLQRLSPVQSCPERMTILGNSLVGTEICHVFIPGDPVAKGRPRYARRGVWTPRKTRVAEEAFRWILLQAGVTPDTDHAIHVWVCFRCATHQRRDLDNMVKLALDACNGFAWGDDFQVTAITATVQRGHPAPETELRLIRLARWTTDC